MSFATKNASLLNLFALFGKPVPTEDSDIGRAVSILQTIADEHSHSFSVDADELAEEMLDNLKGWSVFNGNGACAPYAESHDGKRADGETRFIVIGAAYALAGLTLDDDYAPDEFDTLDELVTLMGGHDSDDFNFEFDGNEYRLIKSDEDVIWPIYRDAIQELVEDCYSDVLKLDKIPNFIAVSVDWEETAKNAYANGYGHQFSGYDGGECEADGYYIFRTN